MIATSLLTGIAMGLAGSPHCAAMCGPLALWAHGRPGDRGGPGRLARYHAGRLAAYGAIGTVAAVFGAAVSAAGFARPLAVMAAAVMLAQAVAAMGAAPAVLHGRLGRAASRVAHGLLTAARRAGLAGPFGAGLLTGVLPCGWLYAAVAAAAVAGQAGAGALFMAGFAVGSTPVLAGIAWSGGTLGRWAPASARRLAPVGLAMVAVVVLVRAFAAPAPHAHDAMSPPSDASVRGPASVGVHAR